MKIAFGTRAGNHEDQNSRISSVFSRRDQCAPLYLTAPELAEFEKRQDISSLRLACKDEKDVGNKKNATKLESKINYIINYLERLKLEEKRNEYFEAVDDLRARGQPTTHLRQIGEKDLRRKRDPADGKSCQVIGGFFQKNVDATELVSSLVEYLQGRLPVPKTMQQQPKDKPRLLIVPKSKLPVRTLCLLCNLSCATKAVLSRHIERTHTLEEAFECPACRQTGHRVIVDAGAVHWATHVEQQHGKQFAPNPYYSQKPAYCLICSTGHAIRGFGFHFSKAHDKESQYPLKCRECAQNGLMAEIQDKRSWIRHAMEVHGSRDPINGSILKGDLGTALQSRKRKRSVDVLESDGDDISSRFSYMKGEEEEFWVTGRDSDYLESEN